jgi:hypothetical protein
LYPKVRPLSAAALFHDEIDTISCEGHFIQFVLISISHFAPHTKTHSSHFKTLAPLNHHFFTVTAG